MSERFSNRHGFHRPQEIEITIRQDAPYELRGFVIELAYHCELAVDPLRSLLCRVLYKRQDRNNTEYHDVDKEIYQLIDNCDWYRVYDIIEGIAQYISEQHRLSKYEEEFENEINEYFYEKGIGWKLVEGKIEARGSESFEESIHITESQLTEKGFINARSELHEAILDLSRRPKPDITGTIQHSMAALECVAREACGNKKATLGDIMKKYPNILPSPLNEVIKKLWGYCSENGRHILEGREYEFEEAELVVFISSAVATYLTRRIL